MPVPVNVTHFSDNNVQPTASISTYTQSPAIVVPPATIPVPVIVPVAAPQSVLNSPAIPSTSSNTSSKPTAPIVSQTLSTINTSDKNNNNNNNTSMDSISPIPITNSTNNSNTSISPSLPIAIPVNKEEMKADASNNTAPSRNSNSIDNARKDTKTKPRPPGRKGTIFKQGHLVKNWKSRFFILEKGVLTYYESSTTTPPYGKNMKGFLNLNNCTVAVEKTIIRISSAEPANEKGHTELVLDIKYPNERVEWVLAIKEHIEYYSDK
jgi:hypothetical protein